MAERQIVRDDRDNFAGSSPRRCRDTSGSARIPRLFRIVRTGSRSGFPAVLRTVTAPHCCAHRHHRDEKGGFEAGSVARAFER